MTRNLFYTALGLVGLVWTLAIGLANADTTIIHYTGSNIEYRLNDNSEHFTGVGTITITDGTDTITILDRNLGAKKAGTGCEDPSRGSACAQGDDTYGYHFQWGNNYGFNPMDSSIKDNVKSVTTDGAIWNGIYDNSGYYGTTFIKGDSDHGYDYWVDSTNSSSNHDNLRGGGGDYNDATNGFGKNNENRRGPCPEGFHVPSYGELQKLQNMLRASDKRNTGILHNELLIPFAGSRTYNGAHLGGLGFDADLWLSSSFSTSPNSQSLDLGVGWLSESVAGRTMAFSLRCFYNKYEAYPQIFTLNFTGSEGGSVSTGSIEVKEGSFISRDDIEGTVSISGTVVVSGTSDEGYVFSGWLTDCISGTLTTGCNFTGMFNLETYMITYELNGGINSENNLTGYTIKDSITFENPTKEGYTFDGWFTDAEFTTGITISTGTTGHITVYAKWTENKKSSGSSGGGGRSNKTSDTQDSSTSSQNEKNTENVIQSETKGSEEPSNIPMDSLDKSSEGQEILSPSDSSFTKEQKEAYKFAYEKGITTMPTINDANMNGKLNRIAMAKMLSYYAINVLGQKPDETRNNKFNDITDKLDAQYDSGVTLAYQLGIMGINMPDNKFRPDDEVTRAEFATALSRMLYSTPDGKPYYTTHLEKLKSEKILTNDDYKMKELRGYVMIMLKRSAK